MASTGFSPSSFGVLLAAVGAPLVAHSAVYLTEEQAAHQIFGDSADSTPVSVRMVRKILPLTPAEVARIEDLSGEKVRVPEVVAWVRGKDVVFVDQVLGKHEFITYGVGISQGGKVSGVEILEYRETYGGQVRTPEWRKQFVGKDGASPFKLNKDIVNISGATLSSAHVTAGVRRLVRTYEVVRERL